MSPLAATGSGPCACSLPAPGTWPPSSWRDGTTESVGGDLPWRDCVIPRSVQPQHDLGEESGARREVRGGRALALVVADAALTWHEDHAGGAESGHVLRVVCRAGNDPHVRQPLALGGGLDQLADPGIE